MGCAGCGRKTEFLLGEESKHAFRQAVSAIAGMLSMAFFPATAVTDKGFFNT
jgi:phosphopantothenate synthetase